MAIADTNSVQATLTANGRQPPRLTQRGPAPGGKSPRLTVALRLGETSLPPIYRLQGDGARAAVSTSANLAIMTCLQARVYGKPIIPRRLAVAELFDKATIGLGAS